MARRSLGRAVRKHRAHVDRRTRTALLESLEPRQLLAIGEGSWPSGNAVDPDCG